jgi:hypothetical protein
MKAQGEQKWPLSFRTGNCEAMKKDAQNKLTFQPKLPQINAERFTVPECVTTH